MKLYLLTHVYEDEFSEKIKFIGIFSTLDLAEMAVEELKKADGFSTYPKGFQIDEQTLDLVGWREGFNKW